MVAPSELIDTQGSKEHFADFGVPVTALTLPRTRHTSKRSKLQRSIVPLAFNPDSFVLPGCPPYQAHVRPIFEMNGVATPQGKWREAKDPNGKTYYYHIDTKQTSWTKPEEVSLLSIGNRW